MLKFLFKVLVILENLDEAVEVKIQPKYGWLSYLLWWLFGHKFNVACYYGDLCLVKCSELKELPLTIRSGYKGGRIDSNKIRVEVN